MPESWKPEPRTLGHAEHLRRLHRLGPPAVGQRLALSEIVGGFAELAAGRHDQHDPVTGLGGSAIARRANALVVRVGVEADERGHRFTSIRSLANRGGFEPLVDGRFVDAPVGEHLARCAGPG